MKRRYMELSASSPGRVSLSDMRNGLVLVVVALYLVLNWGFMLVRLPPGGGASGVPVGEILLFLFFVSVSDVKWLRPFARVIFVFPFLVWWMLGLGRALAGVPEHGMWALRDATHVVESLFLWVGFVFAAKPESIDRFFSWLRRVLLIASLYGLTYPFVEFLIPLSPTIDAAAGYTTTILFQYRNTSLLMLMEAARRFMARSRSLNLGSLLFASLLLAAAIGLFQARTNYLQLIAFMMLMAWLRRSALGKIGLALTLGMLGLVFVSVSGIEITGRLGEAISVEFLIRHFLAIFGIENEGVVGAARGVGQRLDWWIIIWQQVTSDVWHMLFGLGYGMPLVDFRGLQDTVVREPHNSYLSIFGRIGFIGIVAFSWGHLLLLRIWFRAYRLCLSARYVIGQDRLLILMVFFVFVWVFSLGEDAFEKPYVAIPYYFFWGVILHYYRHLRRQLNPTARAHEPPGHEQETSDAHIVRP